MISEGPLNMHLCVKWFNASVVNSKPGEFASHIPMTSPCVMVNKPQFNQVCQGLAARTWNCCPAKCEETLRCRENLEEWWLPSGKRWHNSGMSPFSLGKLSISTGSFSIAMFNYQRVVGGTSCKCSRRSTGAAKPSERQEICQRAVALDWMMFPWCLGLVMWYILKSNPRYFEIIFQCIL